MRTTPSWQTSDFKIVSWGRQLSSSHDKTKDNTSTCVISAAFRLYTNPLQFILGPSHLAPCAGP